MTQHRAHDSQARPCISRCHLDDCLSIFQNASPFRTQHDAFRDAIFLAETGVEILKLGEHYSAPSRAQTIQSHKRRPPDAIQHALHHESTTILHYQDGNLSWGARWRASACMRANIDWFGINPKYWLKIRPIGMASNDKVLGGMLCQVS
mmetsp:Transcript_5064/g.7802  ORF Transcript_5064/g.7802 Transcript_5064/m.7802 type:complete len:149 (-) Transcript_5064:332-778(-)